MGWETLVGRETELATLKSLISGLRSGGGAVVLRGDPGVGKSALLREAADFAERSGATVLSAVGVESETLVPFAALHQLLRPRLSRVDSLPPRHRGALLSAFGMEDADSEPYMVAFAALQLLAEEADRSPIVLLIDDAHWIDPSSTDALAFIARRLETELIAAVIAVRDGSDSPFLTIGLDEVVVRPLDGGAAAAVLDIHRPDLDGWSRDRILQLAAGHPLALVELPRGVPSADGSIPGAVPLTLTARLERAFAGRLGALPDEVRTLLLVAAANDSEDLDEALRATEVMTGAAMTVDDLEPALTARIVTLRASTLRFQHPLARSAVYQAATVSERLRAHDALATVLTHRLERRTWHRAASVTGPSEEIARELERASHLARRRGGIRIAISALTRAAQLSRTEAARGRRLCAAAELAYNAGLEARGAELLDQARPLQLGRPERLRISWLQEWFGDPTWSGTRKVRTFCELATRMAEEGDVDGALEALMQVALRCWWTNPAVETTSTLVAAAEDLGAPDDHPTLLTVLAYAGPVDGARSVAGRIAAVVPEDLDDPVDAFHLGSAATAVGAFELAGPFLDSAVARLRSRAVMGLLLQALVSRILTDYFLGRWGDARTAGEEVRRLTEETAQPIYGTSGMAVEALSAAAQGDDAAVERLCHAAEAFFLPLGATTLLAPVEMARGLLALSHGRHQDAFEHLRRVFDPADPTYHRYARHWAVADYVEAAVAVGDLDNARQLVKEMDDTLDRTRSPVLQASLAFARPLVVADGDAEPAFQRALEELPPTWPFLRARLLLAYGMWLRRQRRTAESRAPLRTSREMLDALGAKRWSARARQELRATGEASREPAIGVEDLLTPQELEIVQYAASGLSNREIGQRMYLSHRTISSHLYRIFPKLGITSRGQLHGLLRPDRADDLEGATEEVMD